MLCGYHLSFFAIHDTACPIILKKLPSDREVDYAWEQWHTQTSFHKVNLPSPLILSLLLEPCLEAWMYIILEIQTGLETLLQYIASR